MNPDKQELENRIRKAFTPVPGEPFFELVAGQIADAVVSQHLAVKLTELGFGDWVDEVRRTTHESARTSLEQRWAEELMTS